MYSFQTSDKLFLILEYCSGGDLAEQLKMQKRYITKLNTKIFLLDLVKTLQRFIYVKLY